jgi:AcrR family transcriptional regulator
MASRTDTSARRQRKITQRRRLLAGMVAAVHRHGYAGANVSQVIAAAGVSRPTFYEYFADKDDCFLTAHRELGRALVSEIRQAVAVEAPERAIQAAIRGFVALAEAHPDRARLLVNEVMTGGRAALDEHDRLIDELVLIVEQRLAHTPAAVESPDLPVHMVLGAGRWLLAPPLRRGERHFPGLVQELERWVERYRRPHGEHRWSTLEPGPELALSPHVTPLPLSPQAPLGRGRPKLTAGEVAENQRTRILYATAEAAAAKGYTAMTVADITIAADVDRRVFYKHFRDKQQAFLAIHEIGIQHAMTVAASAFFSAGEWPDRVWEGTRAGVQFEVANPVITHIGYVDSHAVGAPAIQRIDDTRAAFTIFLQEGNGYTSEPLPRLVLEAIAGAVFEVGYQQVRAGHAERVSRLVANSVYLVLAPFLGADAATEFVQAKLRTATAQASSTLACGAPSSARPRRNGVGGNASGPITPVPLHTPASSSSSATTGLIAVCQTTAWEPYSRIVCSLSTRW